MSDTEDSNNEGSTVPSGRISAVQKIAFGVGHVFNDICGTMWYTYVLVYLQFVMQVCIYIINFVNCSY
jgi:hypothetical protein